MLHASRANLNLLVVLHAVLTEGGVTAAGKKLGLSQTAVSNALARLREQFGDPLVVRRGRGVVPTPRAAAMLGELGGALQTLDRLLAPAEGFDPRRCERTFSLALTDDQEVADLPRVFRRFARAMPLAALRVETVESLVAGDGLAAGTVDAALGPSMLNSPGLRQAPLRVERGVLVVRRDHPAVGADGRLSRADFARLPWVDVRVAGDDGVGRRLARKGLAASGLAPPVRCSVPHFFAAAAVVASSDAVAGLPARFAERLAAWLPLRVVEGPTPPFALALSLHWHERTHHDAACAYLRALIVRTLAEPGEGKPPRPPSFGSKPRRPPSPGDKPPRPPSPGSKPRRPPRSGDEPVIRAAVGASRCR